jgi:type I restriction enzyme S subunit
MANLNTAILGAVPFVRPPIRTQTAIAGVLGALDDKIECNQRLARYCSDLAAAETEGHLARGFRESSRARLSDIASTHKGVSYRSEDLRPGPNALVTLKSVSRIGEYQPEGLKPYTGKFKTDQVVIPGDIVVAQTDLTQAAEVIGRAVRVPVASGVETLVASLDLVIVRPTLPGLTREYLYCLLARDDFRYHCRGFANGTTVLHMAGGSIEKYPLDLPSEEEIAEHTAVVKPLLEAAESHLKQNATLRELRDALLPKLLSGEIRVEDAEEQVEDAV